MLENAMGILMAQFRVVKVMSHFVNAHTDCRQGKNEKGDQYVDSILERDRQLTEW
jgi:hypothetical protein